jgi:type II secretory pathway predicted ATPase ExeA
VSINYSRKTTSLVQVAASAPPSTQGSAPDTLTYEPYFGLTEKPFSLDADPRFLYASPTHDAARKGLLAGIRRREGLLVLTGEIGTGKTTMCRTVLRELGRNTVSSLVPDPFAGREDLLKMLLIDFGVLSTYDVTEGNLRQASRTELGYLLSDFLNTLSRDAYAVVIIDEAQNLSVPLIEETRVLFDTFGAKGRLQLLFVGQPELHAKLKLPEMRQVDQRVCGYFRLGAMNAEAVAGYIEHRLHVAGGDPDRILFPPAMVEALHRRTGGVPRLINRVCDRALQLAYEHRVDAVNQEVFDAALIEVGAVTLSPTWDAIIFADGPAKPSPSVPAVEPEPAPVETADPVPVATVAAIAAVAPSAPQSAVDYFPKEADFETDADVQKEADVQKKSGDPVREDAPPLARPTPALYAGRDRSAEKKPIRVRVDWQRGLRPDAEAQPMRTWATRVLIGLAAFATVSVVSVGALMLFGDARPSTLALPAAPSAPAKILPAVVLPERAAQPAAGVVFVGAAASSAEEAGPATQ